MRKYQALAACGLFALLISSATVSVAADVGRLFFTPAERSAFERARRAVEAGPVREKVDPDPDTLVPVIEDLPLEAKPMITIDGYVRRSHGTATL